MKIRTLRKEQLVRGKKIEEVFDFFKRPENLEKITPPSLGFQILTPSPIRMEKGRIIDYRIKVLGIPQRWRSVITDYEPPHRFVDEQLTGPYSFWHHTHEFTQKSEGTLIADQVRYALGWGLAGDLAHALFVDSQLQSIFDYRSKVIEKAFELP